MNPFLISSVLLFLSWNIYAVSSEADLDEASYLITVDHGNFFDKVLRSNDSWIIIFQNGAVDKKWKNLAKSVRGLTWLGTVDVKSQTKLLKEMGLDATSVPEARVYPFGGQKQKLSQWQDVRSWAEAERFAIRSIPADIPIITSSAIESFIKESHSSSTPRFPAIFLTDSREVTPAMKAIKHRFSRYFHLGTLIKPEAEELRKLGLDVKKPPALPSLAVIIKERQKAAPSKTKPQRPTLKQTKAKKSAEDKPRFVTKAVQYDMNHFGEMSYSSIMRFFFSVNHQFRYTLPESTDKDMKIQSMMSDIMDIEQERFDELFDRKQISQSQKTQASSADKRDEQNATKTGPGKPDKSASGGKCPFGFDKPASGNQAEVKTIPHGLRKEEL